MKTLLLACLGLALTACGAARDDSPEGAYRAFAAAANKGEGAQAFARLTAASQASVKRRLQGLAQASGGSMREDAVALVFGGTRGQPPPAVRLLKKERDRATVAVTAGDQTREVTLLREGTEWRVELPGAELARAR